MHHRWIALFAGLFAIASIRPAARAEDPPADPERVLQAAGLVFEDDPYVHSTPRLYTSLAADPRIQTALRALNKGRHPKLALGPVEVYRRILLKQSNELLDILGFRREKDLYWPAEEDELIRQVGLADRLWREIAEDEPRRRARPGQAASAPGTTWPVAPRPSVAVARAPDEARPATAPAMEPWTAAEYDVLFHHVRKLHRQADALQRRRVGLLAEGEARDALDEINRTKGKSSRADLGPNPELERALQKPNEMEGAVQEQDVRRNDRPASPVVAKEADPARAAQDISKLPRYMVLQIPDGITIAVKKPGEGPVLLVRLLGVTSPASPTDIASLRRTKLAEQIANQEVALAHEPGGAPNGGPMAAWVYRVSDGLLVNLAMVKGGYGVTADDTPASLRRTLSSAEQEAIVGLRGLWSPAERDAAAALDRVEEAKRREELKKRVQTRVAARERRTVMREQQYARRKEAARLMHQAWLRQQEWLSQQRQPPPYTVPEIDPGPAAGALALLVCGLLMLADRRRAHAARRTPTGGVSG